MSVFKNNLKRLFQQKSLIIYSIIMVTIAMIAAVFINRNTSQSWDVAIVTSEKFNLEVESINFTVVDTSPKQSDLVTGKYDAIITIEDGNYQIDCIKSQEIETTILALIQGEKVVITSNSQETGEMMIGYLIMFLLMMGSMFLYLYTDDKELKLLNRITTSSLGIHAYLFANWIFNFCFLFIPTTILFYLICFIFKVQILYSVFEVIVLIGLICIFSSSFNMFFYSFIPNKDGGARMSANYIVILSSIISGCFYSFDKGNLLLERIIKFFPQKIILNLANRLNTDSLGQAIAPIIYIIGISVILYVLSMIKNKQDYNA